MYVVNMPANIVPTATCDTCWHSEPDDTHSITYLTNMHVLHTGVVNVLATFVAIVLVDYAGRKVLLIQGGVQMFLSEVVMGIVLGIFFSNADNPMTPAVWSPCSPFTWITVHFLTRVTAKQSGDSGSEGVMRIVLGTSSPTLATLGLLQNAPPPSSPSMAYIFA
jgi:hypothetical protein